MLLQTKHFRIEKENHDLPWIKIFTKTPYKELSELPSEVYQKLLSLYILIEKEMLAYFEPDKINMASFGNMLPHVHIHVMARYKNDAYFPNPLWGEQTNPDAKLQLPSMEDFFKILEEKIVYDEF